MGWKVTGRVRFKLEVRDTDGELRSPEVDRWLEHDGWRWERKLDSISRSESLPGAGKSWHSKLLGCWPSWGRGERPEVSPQQARPHLVQDVLVEVGHVALAGHRAIVIISEVLFQSHGIMGDVQDCVQVVGQHLRQSDSLPPCPAAKTGPRDNAPPPRFFPPLC